MAEYDNNNTGIMSRNNDRKEDWQAEFRGSAEVDGVEYYLDAWVKERKDGSGKFFSIRFKPKNASASQTKTTEATPTEVDEEVPF